jgi:hypothetical protein
LEYIVGSVSTIHRETRFSAGHWSVRVVHMIPAAGSAVCELFQVRHYDYLIRETIDVAVVRRIVGDDVFAQLTEVPPSGWPSPSPSPGVTG